MKQSFIGSVSDDPHVLVHVHLYQSCPTFQLFFISAKLSCLISQKCIWDKVDVALTILIL